MATIGALIGSPARARILAVLFDGRALPASELAEVAGVAPATASEHLEKLVDAGLLSRERQGRQRSYRIASARVAETLEPLVHLVKSRPVPMRVPSRQVSALRDARLCYDHLAGRLGVLVTEAMVERGQLAPRDRDFVLTESGEAFCSGLGIDLREARAKRRMFARQCLDWSERRPHLAGALGAAVANSAFEAGWIERTKQRREIKVTKAGRTAFSKVFGFEF